MNIQKDESPHVTAELIRSMFDVDKMLYYVSPDWWMPRPIYKQQLSPDNPSAKGITSTRPAEFQLVMARMKDGKGGLAEMA